MKDFLNKFMAKNRHLQDRSRADFESLFSSTAGLIYDVIGVGAFKPQRAVNAAVVDSLMVGVARRLEKGRILNGRKLLGRFESLLKNPDYLAAVETGTSQEAIVAKRLKLAIAAFDDLK